MELHQQVKEARKQAKLTQGELAAVAQVGRKDISRFENGENVTMKTFMRIVGALPNLRRLNLGGIELSKDAPLALSDGNAPPPEEGSAAPETSSAAQTLLPTGAATPRELSLLRTLGQLLVEIAGSGK